MDAGRLNCGLCPVQLGSPALALHKNRFHIGSLGRAFWACGGCPFEVADFGRALAHVLFTGHPLRLPNKYGSDSNAPFNYLL